MFTFYVRTLSVLHSLLPLSSGRHTGDARTHAGNTGITVAASLSILAFLLGSRHTHTGIGLYVWMHYYFCHAEFHDIHAAFRLLWVRNIRGVFRRSQQEDRRVEDMEQPTLEDSTPAPIIMSYTATTSVACFLCCRRGTGSAAVYSSLRCDDEE